MPANLRSPATPDAIDAQHAGRDSPSLPDTPLPLKV